MSQMRNKFVKKRDQHEVESHKSSVKSSASTLEARISIHINDDNIPKSEYQKMIREVCTSFGQIKSVHIPDKCRKGNLVFVEFDNPSVAEKAIKFINSDRSLHMVANAARAPKQRSQASNGHGNSSAHGFSPKQPQSSNFHNRNDSNGMKDEYLSWRSPRESTQNRPLNGKPTPTTAKNPHSPKSPAPHPDPTEGLCNLCKRRATLKCARCFDFYCSHQCQKVDWPQHKRHCIPLPELVPASATVETIKEHREASAVMTVSKDEVSSSKIEGQGVKKDLPTTFSLSGVFPNSPPSHRDPRPHPDRMIVYCDEDPKSGDIVAITWPCSTNRVFIIQNDGKMGEEYRQILTWASRPENHGPPFTESPEKGTMVFAEFENDWYRAIIQKVIDAAYVLVAFFDFGNAEQLHFSKLRQYTNNEDVVRYTYGVFLKDCPYDAGQPLPDNVGEYLKTLADQFTPLRLRYNGAWDRNTNVELFIAETDVCVNDKICALLGTSRGEHRKNREIALQKVLQQSNAPRVQKIYYDDLQFERIATENKTRVKVSCRDGLEMNNIWCHLESAEQAIKKINETVNEFMNKQENLAAYVPETNEICVVKTIKDDNYCRAVLVEEIDEEKAKVMLIDSGEFKWIAKDSIFKLDKTLALPVYTHMCRINGFPRQITGELFTFLKEELEEDSSFVVENITFDENDDLFVLHMPRLLNEAISSGFVSDETCE